MRSFLLGQKTEVKTIPTARDYVQNGLVAMWDGIENAGYGVHDNSLAYWYDLAREDGGGTAVRVASADGSSWNELGLLIPAGKNLAVGGDGTTYMSEPFGSADTITDYTFEIGLDVQDFSSGISPFSLVRVSSTSVEIGRPWAEKQMRMAKATRIRISYDADNTVEQINLDEFVGTSPRFFITDVNSATHGAIWLNGEERAQSIVNLDMSGKWRYCPILFNPSGSAFRLLYTRVYNRALTDAEIAENYAVDQRRFGL